MRPTARPASAACRTSGSSRMPTIRAASPNRLPRRGRFRSTSQSRRTRRASGDLGNIAAALAPHVAAKRSAVVVGAVRSTTRTASRAASPPSREARPAPRATPSTAGARAAARLADSACGSAVVARHGALHPYRRCGFAGSLAGPACRSARDRMRARVRSRRGPVQGNRRIATPWRTATSAGGSLGVGTDRPAGGSRAPGASPAGSAEPSASGGSPEARKMLRQPPREGSARRTPRPFAAAFAAGGGRVHAPRW